MQLMNQKSGVCARTLRVSRACEALDFHMKLKFPATHMASLWFLRGLCVARAISHKLSDPMRFEGPKDTL